MDKIKEVVNSKTCKYKEGYPLIKEDLSGAKPGSIVTFVDEHDKFIAKGYTGKQNKGFGWILTTDQDEEINYDFFQNRIMKALSYRKDLYTDESTNAFRIFNNEGDGIGGLTIDYYDEHFLITWYNEGIYQFKDYIVETLKQITAYKSIYEKKRFGENGKYVNDDEFVCGERPEFPIIIKENNIKYAIYFNDGAMTGIFLDQREVRKKIMEEYSSNRKVLNTFSYTGAFSVVAAKGGAKKTISIDLANRSLEKTEENFKINNLSLDMNENSIIVQDVFNYFDYAKKNKEFFDLIILDPPSFSRSKHNVFSAKNDYESLIDLVIPLTRENGIIVASTNCAQITLNDFKSIIKDSFSRNFTEYEVLEKFRLPKDFKTLDSFKEGNYLKVFFIKVKRGE